jgi:hypothetical protein
MSVCRSRSGNMYRCRCRKMCRHRCRSRHIIRRWWKHVHLWASMGRILHKVIVKSWVTVKVGWWWIHNPRIGLIHSNWGGHLIGRNWRPGAWNSNLPVIFNWRRKGTQMWITRATHIWSLLSMTITSVRGAQGQRRSWRGLFQSASGWQNKNLMRHLENCEDRYLKIESRKTSNA